MPSTMKGPAIFLAQFAGDAAPFNSLPSIAKWAAGLGYKGIQIPSWDARLFDLEKAAKSKTYCDEVKGICKDAGVEITELSTHLQGQLVAVHPAYDSRLRRVRPGRNTTTTRRPGRNGRSSRSRTRPRPRSISASRRRSPSPARWPSPISIRGRSARPG